MAKFIPVNQLEPLQVNVSDIAAKWKKWKRDFSNYAYALAGEDLTDARKVGLLKHDIGDDGNDIFESFTFLKADGTVEAKPTYDAVIAKFDTHFVPKTCCEWSHKMAALSLSLPLPLSAYIETIDFLLSTPAH